MTERLQAPEYPDDFKVRRVTSIGALKCGPKNIYIAKFLAGQPIGFRQTDDDEWDLFYGPILLGHLLRRANVWRIERIT